jgi:hypothetical protein
MFGDSSITSIITTKMEIECDFSKGNLNFSGQFWRAKTGACGFE